MSPMRNTIYVYVCVYKINRGDSIRVYLDARVFPKYTSLQAELMKYQDIRNIDRLLILLFALIFHERNSHICICTIRNFTSNGQLLRLHAIT